MEWKARLNCLVQQNEFRKKIDVKIALGHLCKDKNRLQIRFKIPKQNCWWLKEMPTGVNSTEKFEDLHIENF